MAPRHGIEKSTREARLDEVNPGSSQPPSRETVASIGDRPSFSPIELVARVARLGASRDRVALESRWPLLPRGRSLILESRSLPSEVIGEQEWLPAGEGTNRIEDVALSRERCILQ